MEFIFGEGSSKSKLFFRAVVRKFWWVLPSVAATPMRSSGDSRWGLPCRDPHGRAGILFLAGWPLKLTPRPS